MTTRGQLPSVICTRCGSIFVADEETYNTIETAGRINCKICNYVIEFYLDGHPISSPFKMYIALTCWAENTLVGHTKDGADTEKKINGAQVSQEAWAKYLTNAREKNGDNKD